MEFNAFPKMGRWSREVVISEKIDGSNGQIFIGEDGEFLVGSRTRWITPEDDNYGFARWAHEHKDELMQLGPGRHFGEWWGSGIQRKYGYKNGERFWSLFNTIRWCEHDKEPQQIPTGDPRQVKMQDVLPACCRLVPVLWRGNMDALCVPRIMDVLSTHGSYAAEFDNPEGIVIFHTAANVGFKKTFEKDNGKGEG
jgi:hypothetical protein